MPLHVVERNWVGRAAVFKVGGVRRLVLPVPSFAGIIGRWSLHLEEECRWEEEVDHLAAVLINGGLCTKAGISEAPRGSHFFARERSIFAVVRFMPLRSFGHLLVRRGRDLESCPTKHNRCPGDDCETFGVVAVVQLVPKVVRIKRTPPFAVDKPPNVLRKQERVIVDLDEPIKLLSAVLAHPDPAPPNLLPDVLAVPVVRERCLGGDVLRIKVLAQEPGHVDRDDVVWEVWDEVCPRRSVDEEFNHITPLSPSVHDFGIPCRSHCAVLDTPSPEDLLRVLGVLRVRPDERHHAVDPMRTLVLAVVLPRTRDGRVHRVQLDWGHPFGRRPLASARALPQASLQRWVLGGRGCGRLDLDPPTGIRHEVARVILPLGVVVVPWDSRHMEMQRRKETESAQYSNQEDRGDLCPPGPGTLAASPALLPPWGLHVTCLNRSSALAAGSNRHTAPLAHRPAHKMPLPPPPGLCSAD
eukprot:m.203708 g.203708  ORF g.203708 m.203708 type:complete len:470 (-) comp25282_c0_seq2:2-1411(-)